MNDSLFFGGLLLWIAICQSVAYFSEPCREGHDLLWTWKDHGLNEMIGLGYCSKCHLRTWAVAERKEALHFDWDEEEYQAEQALGIKSIWKEQKRRERTEKIRANQGY